MIALKRQNVELKGELTQLKELFSLLYMRSPEDSIEILARIRGSGDPVAVLQAVRQADLLLNPETAKTTQTPTLQKLDAEALAYSSIPVPARPWTTLAGDGIVSELITNFFQNDHGYLVPFIHRGCFIRDMRNASREETSYCSPTLLNAICALKCVTAPLLSMLAEKAG
jgi:hypothetical protein